MFYFLFLFLFCFSMALGDELPVDVVFPRKNQSLPALSKTFIYGAALEGFDGELKINGEPVSFHESGGFLAFVPMSKEGFWLEWSKGGTWKEGRALWPVRKPKKWVFSTSSSPVFDSSWFSPKQGFGAVVGEGVLFECKTLPGKEVFLLLKKSNRVLPMEEFQKNGVKGLYRKSVVLSELVESEGLEFFFQNGEQRVAFSPELSFEVRDSEGFGWRRVTEDGAKARFRPGKGYDSFLRKGSVLKSTGFRGSWVRLALKDGFSVWVEKRQVEVASYPGFEVQVLGNVRVLDAAGGVRFQLPGVGRGNVTYRDAGAGFSMDLDLFPAVIDVDRVLISPPSLKGASFAWEQMGADWVRAGLKLPFSPAYGVLLDWGKRHLALEVRKPPAMRSGTGPLKVCLDAGHGGDDSGAVSPHRVPEKTFNMALVKKCEALLKAKGFEVVLVRDKDVAFPLYERGRFAEKAQADLFISVHFNSCRPGANPYDLRRVESYFFNRAGRVLGEAIHPKVAEASSIQDGGLRFGNFAVCRNFAVPSILLELDYMILPEAEERIQDEAYQEKMALAIYEGILAWSKEG